MNNRQIIPVGNNYIKKYISFNRKIPYITGLQELEENKEFFNKKEYFALYQQFVELEIYEKCSREERQLLVPIVGIEYNNNNSPILMFPSFTPLLPQEKAIIFSEEECISFLYNDFSVKGYEDAETGKFFESIIRFCDKYDLSLDNCLFNLSNIGYNKALGFRLINYGITESLLKGLF